VLAAGDKAYALSGYIASQLEALAADITWRVFVVDDLAADVVTLTPLRTRDEITSQVPGVSVGSRL